MVKKILSVMLLACIFMGVNVTVMAAETYEVPLMGYYVDELEDFRRYGTATITGVQGTTQWGAQTAYIIDENSVITIDCEVGYLVALDKNKKEYEDGYYLATGYGDVVSDACSIDCTVADIDGGSYILPGATVRFHKPGEWLLLDMTLGRENGFYEKTCIVFQVRNSAADEAPKVPMATCTSSVVYVNGTQTSFDAYNINGNNYFKLRDLAQVFSGTEKQFEVSWDGKINLISGKPYTSVGGELAGGDGSDKAYTKTESEILANGSPVSFEAYNIGGNNYFKLRDVCRFFDIGVTWDAATGTIGLDTSISYTE